MHEHFFRLSKDYTYICAPKGIPNIPIMRRFKTGKKYLIDFTGQYEKTAEMSSLFHLKYRISLAYPKFPKSMDISKYIIMLIFPY